MWGETLGVESELFVIVWSLDCSLRLGLFCIELGRVLMDRVLLGWSWWRGGTFGLAWGLM